MVPKERHDEVVPGLTTTNGSNSAPSTPTHLSTTTKMSYKKKKQLPAASQDEFEFAVATLDLINADRKTLLSYLWSFLLAVTALLDFIATVVPMWFVYDVKARAKPVTAHDIYEFRRRDDGMFETNDPLFVDLLVWLRRHALNLSFAFSLLCFVNVFIKAHRHRRHAVMERDRSTLLGQRTTTKSETNSNATTAVTKEKSWWWKGAWGVYSRVILFQLLLLPVSFYFLIYHWLHLWVEEDDSKVDEDEDITIHIRGLRKLSAKTEHVRATVIRSGVRVFRFAVRHPKLFQSRMTKILTGVRWAKYLAPLIGTFNKLLGNSLDLLTRYHQHRQAVQAERARQLLWNQLSSTERRVHAAVRIESCYRSYKCRKAVAAMRLIRGEKEVFAALKVQKVLRGMLARARARLLVKERELQLLFQEEEKIGDVKAMSAEERKRMYKLRDELNMVADKLINQNLLLRPNTRFSVAWRFVFVACVVFEISVLILQPRLAAKFKDKKTGKPLDICRIMHETLVPNPIHTWDVCAVKVEKPKKDPIIIRAVHRVVPHKKTKQIDTKPRKPPRWYCHRYIALTHSWYISALKWLISEFMVFLAFVSFIDVPISFFIGELDPVTGALVPKHWFLRWILPGIVLQLIVNPQMGAIASFVVSLVKGSFLVGVERAYRWVIMLLLPLLALLVHLVVVYIWHPMVKRQNEIVISGKAK